MGTNIPPLPWKQRWLCAARARRPWIRRAANPVDLGSLGPDARHTRKPSISQQGDRGHRDIATPWNLARGGWNAPSVRRRKGHGGRDPNKERHRSRPLTRATPPPTLPTRDSGQGISREAEARRCQPSLLSAFTTRRVPPGSRDRIGSRKAVSPWRLGVRRVDPSGDRAGCGRPIGRGRGRSPPVPAATPSHGWLRDCLGRGRARAVPGLPEEMNQREGSLWGGGVTPALEALRRTSRSQESREPCPNARP